MINSFSRLIYYLPFAQYPGYERPLPYSVKLFRSIDKNLNSPTPNAFVEHFHVRVRALNKPLGGRFHKNHIHIAAARLGSPGKRPKKDGFTGSKCERGFPDGFFYLLNC